MDIKVKEFLEKYKCNIELINKEEFINNLTCEMVKGLEDKSTLPMLLTYVYDGMKAIDKGNHLLIDAGGTHLRFAIGHVENNECIITKLADYDMLGKEKELTCDEFYNEIARLIKELNVSFTNIGYCFSFACEMGEDLDGKVIVFGKGLKLDKAVGSFVAKETLKALHNQGINNDINTNIYIMNDTVASLLGAIMHNQKEGNYIGYILGTGTNTCYFEDTKNIKKTIVNKQGRMAINVESSNFDKIHLSDIERRVLDKTEYTHVFERVTSGLYFKQTLNETLNILNDEGLIRLKEPANFALKDYSHFIEKTDNPIINNIDSKDEEFINELLKELIRVNAYRTSLMLTTILNKSNIKGMTNYIAIEGSTYSKLPYIKGFIQNYIRDLNKDKLIEFIEGDDLNLKGSLLLASHK